MLNHITSNIHFIHKTVHFGKFHSPLELEDRTPLGGAQKNFHIVCFHEILKN